MSYRPRKENKKWEKTCPKSDSTEHRALDKFCHISMAHSTLSFVRVPHHLRCSRHHNSTLDRCESAVTFFFFISFCGVASAIMWIYSHLKGEGGVVANRKFICHQMTFCLWPCRVGLCRRLSMDVVLRWRWHSSHSQRCESWQQYSQPSIVDRTAINQSFLCYTRRND